MDEAVKKRIIGFSLIAVSAAILLPLFLNGDGYRERHLESRIPAAPPLPEIASLEPETVLLPDTSAYPPPQEAEEISITETAAVAAVEVKSDVADKKDKSAAGANSKPAKTIPQSEKRPVVRVADKRPILDQQNVPVAWTLQLASFKDESNARALRKQLVGAGHKVYTRQNSDLYKVYVGPDLQKDRLDTLKARLKKDFGLDGIIVRFTTR